MTDVGKYDDTIDTRDAQNTIDSLYPWKLENEAGTIVDTFKTKEEAEEYANENHDAAGLYVVEYDDESELLADLLRLRDQVDGSEWDSGTTLIADSHFADYARDDAESMHRNGLFDEWPFTNIDWNDAAEDLKMDYTSVSFGGETYWVR